MQKNIEVLLVDAFTLHTGKGNRAGVVLDATGLSATEMQAIAARVNVSETAFITPADADKEYDVHIRYFTPKAEVPICGHATIGAHFARAKALGLREARIVCLTGAGVLPVDIVQKNGSLNVIMTQGKVSLTPPYNDAISQRIISALGLSPEDLEPKLPIQEASTGHSKVMIPIQSESTLDALTPDMDALTEISGDIGCNGFFVFTLNGPDAPYFTSGRMFAPAIGIEEDPVTGNGNGPCGAYLSRHGVLPAEERVSYQGKQGVAMGKEGCIDVTVHRNDNGPYKVQVGGTAVNAGHMQMTLTTSPDGKVQITSVNIHEEPSME